MSEDLDVTAQSKALSPALRAQEKWSKVCPNCGGPIAIRNPTGTCDHLYWPEYLTPEARAKIELHEPRGLSAAEAPGAAGVTSPNPSEVS